MKISFHFNTQLFHKELSRLYYFTLLHYALNVNYVYKKLIEFLQY